MSTGPLFQTYTESKSAGSIIEGFISVVFRAVTGLVREYRVRRDIARLAKFEDTMLHDIGVGRSEIESTIRQGRVPRNRTVARAG